MDRRDVLKAMALAAGGVAVARAEAQEAVPGGGTGAAPAAAGGVDIAPIPEDFFVPGRFDGKTVIVTGCARGMGRQAAIRLAREGANVVGVDWLEEEGRAVIDGIAAEGLAARFVAGDVSENAVCEEVVRVAVADFGGLDLALNNAGVMDAVFPGEPVDYAAQRDRVMARIHEASDEYWDVVMRVNATGVFRCLRAELRQMVAQGRGGAIVNVGSVAGLRGFGGTPSYVASKHALNGLTKNAAIDYAPFGIRVNSVNMANTDTPMVHRAMELVRQKLAASGEGPGISLIKTQSLLQYADSAHRDATPAEQVAVMLFLLSPEASNLTGANFATDGGFTTY
jgi:NAD(P)-dependent dehydrogenase (short-subunit alcohol dehydrogenase family)